MVNTRQKNTAHKLTLQEDGAMKRCLSSGKSKDSLEVSKFVQS